MTLDRAYCEEIVTQIEATRKAAQSLGCGVLVELDVNRVSVTESSTVGRGVEVWSVKGGDRRHLTSMSQVWALELRPWVNDLMSEFWCAQFVGGGR